MNALANHAKMEAPALTLTIAIHVSVPLDSQESIVIQVRLNSNCLTPLNTDGRRKQSALGLLKMWLASNLVYLPSGE